jgi:hypothetical protein
MNMANEDLQNLQKDLPKLKLTATRCAVCNLPADQRAQIDRELVAGVKMTEIAARIGRHKTSVLRHRDHHLLPAVRAELARQGAEASAGTAARPDIRRGVRPVVERLVDDAMAWLDRARTEDAWPMAAAFIREARQSAELVARLSGELAGPVGQPAGPTNVVVLPVVVPAPNGGPAVDAGPVVDGGPVVDVTPEPAE